MTRRTLWDTLLAAATTHASPQEARAITARICEERFGLRFTDVVVEPSAPYPLEGGSENLELLLTELRRARPVQYILGQTLFCELPFHVREGVLIPRPETEELVRWIVEDAANAHPLTPPRLLDIGTGSGCIAVSAARLLTPQGAKVSAVDVSPLALAVAAENAALNGVNVEFRACDILTQQPSGLYDIVVSNPPYVTRSEAPMMEANVLRHEPELALFVDDADPLLFYRTIARRSLTLLPTGGLLYFEINERFSGQTTEMLRQLGYRDITLRHDLFQKPRMVRAQR